MASPPRQASPARDGVISIGSPSVSPNPQPNAKRAREQSLSGEEGPASKSQSAGSESEASPSSRLKAIGKPRKRRKLRKKRLPASDDGDDDDEEEEGGVFEPRVRQGQSVPAEATAVSKRVTRSQSAPLQGKDSEAAARPQTGPPDPRSAEQRLEEEKEWTVVEGRVKVGKVIFELPDLPAEPTDADLAYWCERFVDLNKDRSGKKIKPAFLCQALDKRVAENVREGRSPKSVSPRAHYFKRKWLFGSTAGDMGNLLSSMRDTYAAIQNLPGSGGSGSGSGGGDGREGTGAHGGALFDAQTNRSWILPEELARHASKDVGGWVHDFARLNAAQWDAIDVPLVARTLKRQEITPASGKRQARTKAKERHESLQETVQAMFDQGRFDQMVREAKEAHPKVAVPEKPAEAPKKEDETPVREKGVAAIKNTGSAAENFIAISSGSDDDDQENEGGDSDNDDGYEPTLEPGATADLDNAGPSVNGGNTPDEDTRRQQKRYFPSAAPSATLCLLCGRPGHTAALCTHATCPGCRSPSHGLPSCPSLARCAKCRQLGHAAAGCGEKLALTREEGLACGVCGGADHLEDECTAVWRSYHPLAGEKEEEDAAAAAVSAVRKVAVLLPSCALCGSEEHYASDCADARELPANPTWSIRNRDLHVDPASTARGIEEGHRFRAHQNGRAGKDAPREPERKIRGRATHVEYESEDDSETEFLGRHPVRGAQRGAGGRPPGMGQIRMASNIQLPGRKGGPPPLPPGPPPGGDRGSGGGGGRGAVLGPGRGRGGFSLPPRPAGGGLPSKPPPSSTSNRFGRVPPPAAFGTGGQRGGGGGGGGGARRGRGGRGGGRGRGR